MDTAGKGRQMMVPNALLAPLQARSGEEAIAELLLALFHARQTQEEPVGFAAPNPPTIFGGIALASVCIPSLDRIVMALGTCPAGVRFESEPDADVRVILLTAWGTAPAGQLRAHFEALLHGAGDPAFRHAILAARSGQEAAACFPSAPSGHYQTVFTRHYSPLVPELVYVTD